MKDETLFCYREFATQAAAVSVLATTLRDATGSELNQTDREALARTMIRNSSGKVSGSWGEVSWRREDDEPHDLLYVAEGY